MSENLTVEAPDFRRIRKGDMHATEDAIRLLWFVTNDEIATRRRAVRAAVEQEVPKGLSAAPTTNQNNYDTQGAGILLFTGATNFNLTGIRGTGREFERVTIHNIGSATITVVDDSASSDAGNRIISDDGNDISLTTNKTVVLHYLNTRWRELSLA